MKKFIIAIIILSLLMLGLFFYFHKPEKNTIQIIINNEPFILETAITTAEKQKGLMFRESMPEDHGMIFIFNQEEERSFWMKNTLIPLDIIFIDENNKITSIQTAQPCTQDPCSKYQAHAQYIIELNAGRAKELGLKEGDELDINLNNN
ncbi:MAG: hypothetical protein RL557_257 [archaeon]|jgi:uncharacterized membrane protein (UPF0127 family)